MDYRSVNKYFFLFGRHNKEGGYAFYIKSVIIMSEKELNAYRLTSMEEPTDEMLSAIMREAAEEASKRWKEAEMRFFDQLRAMTQQTTASV